MAERFDTDMADDDDSLASLKGSSYFKTEEFDPRGRVFVIAGFRKDEIKNSDGPATEANVMFFQDEEKGFILKSTKVDQLIEATGVSSKKAAIGKEIEIFRDSTLYKGKKVACMALRAPTGQR